MKTGGGPQQGLEAEKEERRKLRRARLDDAFTELENLMHEVEGTTSGTYSTREMSISGTHLQTAWLWAREALEE